jgi:RHS repeat-associated protein
MYYHSDGNGNVTTLVSPSQYIVAKYLFDAFGNTLSASGSLAQANLYRFSSKETHLNSGLLDFLHRYYDPNLQRWPNRDPIEEQGGINLYEFVGNSAANRTDPVGFGFGGVWHPNQNPPRPSPISGTFVYVDVPIPGGTVMVSGNFGVPFSPTNTDTSVLVTYGPPLAQYGYQTTGSALEPIDTQPALNIGGTFIGVFITPVEISPYVGLPVGAGSIGIGATWNNPWQQQFTNFYNNLMSIAATAASTTFFPTIP